MSISFRIQHWGLLDYSLAQKRQEGLVREVFAGGDPVLVLCEHPKVITLGKKTHEENLLFSREALSRDGFAVCEVDRGGDVTLHGPGQLIIYPIINLKKHGLDLKTYLRKLEQVAVDLLADFGIVAAGSDDRRGVWVGENKIASIGIGVRHWVTYHGMGLNVSTDLRLFKNIRACGLDVRMTSLEHILGEAPSMARVMEQVERHFTRVFGFTEVRRLVEGARQ